MDKKRQAVLDDVRECLRQVALELEAAAEGARNAASSASSAEGEAWTHVQQMYSRLEQATYLAGRFQKTINDAIKQQGE